MNTIIKSNFRKISLLIVMSILTGMCFTSCSEDEPTPSPSVTSGLNEGVKGSDVTITGTNFPTDTTKIEVTVGGIAAKVTGATETTITFTIPDGVATGDALVVVTINGKIVDLEDDILTVKNKIFTISGLSKSSGKMGDRIKIEGSNLNSTDFTVFMNNGSGTNVKQKIKSAAADGSYIEIELVAKTFSGRFEVTRISDNMMVTTGKFTYEETYSIEEIKVANFTSMNDLIINSKGQKFINTGAGIFEINDQYSILDTFLFANMLGIHEIELGFNSDILLGRTKPYIARYKKEGDTYDTVLEIGTVNSFLHLINSNEKIYYTRETDEKIYAFSEYNGTIEEVISISGVEDFALNSKGNIIAVSNSEDKLYEVDVVNKTKTEILDFSTEITGILDISIAVHPVTGMIYLFSMDTDRFYSVKDGVLTELSFEGILFDEAQSIVFDKNSNAYLVSNESLYYLTID